MKNETNTLKYVIRNPGDMKSVRLQLRTTPKISKWMKDRGVSPTLVFDNAIKKLMDKVEWIPNNPTESN